MATYSGAHDRIVCTKCWRFTEKQAANATWGSREAFRREVASELTWKTEWELAKQI